MKTFLLILFPCLLFGQTVDQKRAEAIRAFDKYLGIKEKTGRNDGRDLDRLHERCGSFDGAPWCSCLQMNVLLDIGVKSKLTPLAASGFSQEYLLPKKYDPKPACYVGYWNGKRVCHIEMFETNHNETHIITLAGNVGLKEGGEGVRRKIVPKGRVYRYSDILAVEMSSIEAEYAKPYEVEQEQVRVLDKKDKPSTKIAEGLYTEVKSETERNFPESEYTIYLNIVLTLLPVFLISKIQS